MRSFSSVALRPFAAALVLLPVASLSAAEPLEVVAYLDGEGVVGGGDTAGTGDFIGNINLSSGEMCYTLAVEDMVMTGASIHEGKEGKAGASVMVLEMSDGEVCAKIDGKLAKSIGAKPGNYYVNVSSETFPGGALRAQMEF